MTGHTTEQLKATPLGAVYIWPNNDLAYPKQLADSLGRTDIVFGTPGTLSRGNVAYFIARRNGLVIDHAVSCLSFEQREVLEDIFYSLCREKKATTIPFYPVSALKHIGKKITAAAIRATDGRVFHVPRPGRHGDVMVLMVGTYGFERPVKQEHIQGFITEDGMFWDRVQAHRLASYAKQILPGHGGHRELYSEDLW